MRGSHSHQKVVEAMGKAMGLKPDDLKKMKKKKPKPKKPSKGY